MRSAHANKQLKSGWDSIINPVAQIYGIRNTYPLLPLKN